MQNLELFSTHGLKHHRAWVAGVFGAALLVRLAILAFAFPGNDAVYYYDDAKIALNLIEGKGYSISYEYRNWLFYEAVLKTAKLENPIMEGTRTTAVKQPAYPLLLAGLFYCFGAKNFFVVFLFHSVLSSLTVTMLFLLLRRHSPLGALAVASGTAVARRHAVAIALGQPHVTITLSPFEETLADSAKPRAVLLVPANGSIWKVQEWTALPTAEAVRAVAAHWMKLNEKYRPLVEAARSRSAAKRARRASYEARGPISSSARSFA